MVLRYLAFGALRPGRNCANGMLCYDIPISPSYRR
jgi:hypothetical protein